MPLGPRKAGLQQNCLSDFLFPVKHVIGHQLSFTKTIYLGVFLYHTAAQSAAILSQLCTCLSHQAGGGWCLGSVRVTNEALGPSGRLPRAEQLLQPLLGQQAGDALSRLKNGRVSLPEGGRTRLLQALAPSLLCSASTRPAGFPGHTMAPKALRF